jgi:hypothetical protein
MFILEEANKWLKAHNYPEVKMNSYNTLFGYGWMRVITAWSDEVCYEMRSSTTTISHAQQKFLKFIQEFYDLPKLTRD